MTLPSGHLHTLENQAVKKWLQGRGMAAKEPGGNQYGVGPEYSAELFKPGLPEVI